MKRRLLLSFAAGTLVAAAAGMLAYSHLPPVAKVLAFPYFILYVILLGAHGQKGDFPRFVGVLLLTISFYCLVVFCAWSLVSRLRRHETR